MDTWVDMVRSYRERESLSARVCVLERTPHLRSGRSGEELDVVAGGGEEEGALRVVRVRHARQLSARRTARRCHRGRSRLYAHSRLSERRGHVARKTWRRPTDVGDYSEVHHS